MARSGPIGSVRDWLLHQLVANFWFMPLLAIIAGLGFAYGVLLLDEAVLTDWLARHNLHPVASSDTAQDFAIALIGIDVALLSLFISITLIVLTLAASALGVRLVDRWLDKPIIRMALSYAVFCLVHALVLLMAIDPAAPLGDLPLGSIWTALLLQLGNLGMVGVAAHDLGRTMFVDRAIAHLGKDAATGSAAIVPALPHPGPWLQAIGAPREGYVEGMDLDDIASVLGKDAQVRFLVAPGQHVLCSEPLMQLASPVEDADKLLAAIPIGDFRSNAQNTVFQIRLLVEVGARALSPGINDFYTALTCSDKLACAMIGQAESWIDEGLVPRAQDYPGFELHGQDFRALFDSPLKAFRQAAADYPAVAIRMIDNYARVAALAGSQQLCAYLHQNAAELADHAVMRAQLPQDAQAIRDSLARFHETPALAAQDLVPEESGH